MLRDVPLGGEISSAHWASNVMSRSSDSASFLCVISLDSYLRRFQRLRVNRKADSFSPHKPGMLLAVIELAEAGALSENRILVAPPLLERYRALFDLVRSERDHPNPYFPFFHLRAEGFWHLRALPGREDVLAAMKTARAVADIEQNVAYARLDHQLHALLLDPVAREVLRNDLVAFWFPAEHEQLLAQLEREGALGRYERRLRGLTEGRDIKEPAEPDLEKVRSTAFRRTVLEAYDYRCAASGWRIILPDGQVMAEAAHLIPFAASADDDPRNGIALAPSYHWALDRNLIAPGPDLRWHVSKVLDARLRDNAALLDLDGTDLLLPQNARYRPRQDALQYRLEHLRER
jgi:putative restriction endonuclease